jgi:hypothetical protein
MLPSLLPFLYCRTAMSLFYFVQAILAVQEIVRMENATIASDLHLTMFGRTLLTAVFSSSGSEQVATSPALSSNDNVSLPFHQVLWAVAPCPLVLWTDAQLLLV